MCAKYSKLEFLHRKHKACTVHTPENPKTCRIYVGVRTNISSQPAQIYAKEWLRGALIWGHNELAPLGPINTCCPWAGETERQLFVVKREFKW
jgi:hypothetical protein